MSEDDEGPTIEEIFFRELSHLVEPITVAAKDASDGNEAALLDLLESMGVSQSILGSAYEPLKSDVTTIASAYSTIETEVIEPLDNDESPNLAKVDEIFEAFKDIFETLKGLDDIDLSGVSVEFDKLGELVVDYLVITYLDTYHGQAHSLFLMLGVIQKDSPEDVGDIELSALGTVFQDPNQLIADVLGWGLEEFSPYLIFYYVRDLLWERNLPASIEAPSETVQQELQGKAEGETVAIEEQQLRVRIMSVSGGAGSSEMGIQLIPLPADNDSMPGIAVMPYGTLEGEITEEISEQWTFNANMSAAAGWALTVQPDKATGKTLPELMSVEGSFSGEVHGETSIEFDGATDELSETTLLGTPGASRIAVKSFSVAASVDYTGDKVVFTVELPAKGTIGVHPSDFDGFLQKVMPADGIFYNFDATVGWASDSGLYFDRGGTLEVALPQNASLGPLTMKEIWLAAGSGSQEGSSGSESAAGTTTGGGDGETGSGSGGGGGGIDASASGEASGDVSMSEGTIHIAGALSGTVKLGPVSATVKRIGVEADVSFPDEGGNVGPAQIELGFKPPEGVGISIDAGAVTGGGYLEFDYENNRYAGVLQIKAGTLTINAVGLLTTELPSGKDGFSLLIIISGEFSPVQLGLGFTLNGVGGLLGINRTVKGKPLGDAVRAGSLDSVLFPQNPVANAQRIISDLRAIFPPSAGTHVVGPMAKLGWGTPTLITADIGVILEIPTWKIVLLGRLSAVLPDEKAPLIELNLAVSGFLDPPNKRVAIDASLYDSRVVLWTISGDMALRSNWGDNPRFVLSVGGFNPRFEPPSDFPELRRVKASLGAPSGNPKLEYSGYFAVTSNTVQAGAGMYLLAKAGPAKVEGKLAFDALIQFDPFKFIVDFLAKLSVDIKGVGLTIKLDGTLSGPGPFRIKGKLHIEILFLSITVKVNVTIGPAKDQEKLPPAQVLPKLVEEFNKPSNWKAQIPEAGPSLVTLREVETDEETVLAHPLGTIGVRQTVVPLAFTIEKFGNARPGSYNHFVIDSVDVGSGSALDLGSKTTEQFAPAQFTKMSDAEKVDSPPFQAQVAGRKMDHEGVYCGYTSGKQSKNTRSTTLGYECSVIDKKKDNWAKPLSKLGRFAAEDISAISGISRQHSNALQEVSAVAEARIDGPDRFALDDDEREMMHEQAAGLAHEVDFGGGVGNGDLGSTTPDEDDRVTQGGDGRVIRGGSNPDVGGLAGSISMGESGYVVAGAGDMREVDIPQANGEMSKAQAQRALSTFRSNNPEAGAQMRVVEAHKAKSGPAVAPDGGGDQTDPLGGGNQRGDDE